MACVAGILGLRPGSNIGVVAGVVAVQCTHESIARQHLRAGNDCRQHKPGNADRNTYQQSAFHHAFLRLATSACNASRAARWPERTAPSMLLAQMSAVSVPDQISRPTAGFR
ncbi:hypothetical protein D3C79_571390 [compost metagenome]